MTTDLRTEAAQLLDVLVDRLTATRQALGGAHSAGEPGEAGEAGVAGVAGGPGEGDLTDKRTSADGAVGSVCPTCGHDANEASCSGCPLCALLAMLRGERPELTAKLVDGALSSLQAIRTLLAEPTSAAAATHPGSGGSQPQQPAERIDIR